MRCPPAMAERKEAQHVIFLSSDNRHSSDDRIPDPLHTDNSGAGHLRPRQVERVGRPCREEPDNRPAPYAGKTKSRSKPAGKNDTSTPFQYNNQYLITKHKQTECPDLMTCQTGVFRLGYKRTDTDMRRKDMELNELLQYFNTADTIGENQEAIETMRFYSRQAQKITMEINTEYHEPDELAELFSELTGKPVGEHFGLFPPFYTDFGKNITVGNNVFINSRPRRCSCYAESRPCPGKTAAASSCADTYRQRRVDRSQRYGHIRSYHRR